MIVIAQTKKKSSGNYLRMASGTVGRAIIAFSAVTMPIHNAQSLLQGANEIVVVLQEPYES